MRVDAILEDITKLKTCDAIVNSTNYFLSDGAPKSVNHAIHVAAGPELYKTCRKLGTCNTGEAIATSGFEMSCDYIIHTVTPSWRPDKSEKANKQLANCYINCLTEAQKKGARSIAFPSLGTGHCHFPSEMAAETAVSTVKQFMKENPGSFDSIIWSLYRPENVEIYKATIARLMPEAAAVSEPEPVVKEAEAAEAAAPVVKSVVSPDDKILDFCRKYYLVLKLIDKDSELNEWCRNYDANEMSSRHSALKDILQFRMTSDARRAGLITDKADEILADEGITYENLKDFNDVDLSKIDPAALKAALEIQFKADEKEEGVLIREGVASGFVVRLVKALYNMLSVG